MSVLESQIMDNQAKIKASEGALCDYEVPMW